MFPCQPQGPGALTMRPEMACHEVKCRAVEDETRV